MDKFIHGLDAKDPKPSIISGGRDRHSTRCSEMSSEQNSKRSSDMLSDKDFDDTSWLPPNTLPMFSLLGISNFLFFNFLLCTAKSVQIYIFPARGWTYWFTSVKSLTWVLGYILSLLVVRHLSFEVAFFGAYIMMGLSTLSFLISACFFSETAFGFYFALASCGVVSFFAAIGRSKTLGVAYNVGHSATALECQGIAIAGLMSLMVTLLTLLAQSCVKESSTGAYVTLTVSCLLAAGGHFVSALYCNRLKELSKMAIERRCVILDAQSLQSKANPREGTSISQALQQLPGSSYGSVATGAATVTNKPPDSHSSDYQSNETESCHLSLPMRDKPSICDFHSIRCSRCATSSGVIDMLPKTEVVHERSWVLLVWRCKQDLASILFTTVITCLVFPSVAYDWPPPPFLTHSSFAVYLNAVYQIGDNIGRQLARYSVPRSALPIATILRVVFIPVFFALAKQRMHIGGNVIHFIIQSIVMLLFSASFGYTIVTGFLYGTSQVRDPFEKIKTAPFVAFFALGGRFVGYLFSPGGMDNPTNLPLEETSD